MTARTTVLLLALIAVVGGYLWWEQSVSPPPADTATAARRGGPPAGATTPVRPFFAFQPDDVVRVQLQQGDTTRAAVRTASGGWPAPAITDLLGALANLGVLVEISSETDAAAQYGLRPPRSVVTIYQSGGASPLVLRLGDRNPPTTGVYVQVGIDGQIGLAGALVEWEFEKAFRALGSPPAPPSQ